MIVSINCNILFTVLEDPVGRNYSGGRCCWLTYQTNQYYGERGIEMRGHLNCQDILGGIIAPHGLTPYDVHDCFVPFMNVVYDSHGGWRIGRQKCTGSLFCVASRELMIF